MSNLLWANEENTVIYPDVAANASTVWAKPKVAIDLDQIVVQQPFYSSEDGTRVPIFVVRRRDVMARRRPCSTPRAALSFR